MPTAFYSGSVVTSDASLNTYLNNDYYNNTLGDDKQYIVDHKFSVGKAGPWWSNESIESDIENEKEYQWVGKIGLINVTEYMRTTSNNTCTGLYTGFSNKYACRENNWLYKGIFYWTLSPTNPGTQSFAWYIDQTGFLHYYDAYSINIVPAVYIDSNILLSGSGTTSNKYQITGRA